MDDITGISALKARYHRQQTYAAVRGKHEYAAGRAGEDGGAGAVGLTGAVEEQISDTGKDEDRYRRTYNVPGVHAEARPAAARTAVRAYKTEKRMLNEVCLVKLESACLFGVGRN